MVWTDNYVGDWGDDHGRKLNVRRVTGESFHVTLLQNQKPILRPWFNDEPTVDMPAKYISDVLDGDEFAVDLWPPNRGLELILHFEPEYELDEHYRDSLTVGISRDEAHDFLDKYYNLLPLGHFFRISEGPTEDRK